MSTADQVCQSGPETFSIIIIVTIFRAECCVKTFNNCQPINLSPHNIDPRHACVTNSVQSEVRLCTLMKSL